MTNRMRAGICTSIVAVASVAVAGCAGGKSSIDSQVPALNLTRSITGVWRRAQISMSGTSVSCPDPAEMLAPTTRELTINNIVVDTCGKDEALIFGTPISTGRGRYRLVTLRGTEDGYYTLDGSSLTLIRDMINGTAITTRQRTVFKVTFNDTDKTFSIAPVPQAVALQKVDASQPAFREDGSIIATNVTPVPNSDGSVNTIILSDINEDATVNSDLTITIGPIANSGKSSETPGFSRSLAVQSGFQFVPATPGQTQPTPAPDPHN